MSRWRVVHLVDADIKQDFGFVEAKDAVDAKKVVADSQPNMNRLERAYFISCLEAIPPVAPVPPSPPRAAKLVKPAKEVPAHHTAENFKPNPDGDYARLRDAMDKYLKRRNSTVFVPMSEDKDFNVLKSIFTQVCKIKRFRGYDAYLVNLLDQQGEPGVRIFRD